MCCTLKCTRHRFHFSHSWWCVPAICFVCYWLWYYSFPIQAIQFNFHMNFFIVCRFILFPFDSHNVDECNTLNFVWQYRLHVTACLCVNVRFCIRDSLCTKIMPWPISKILQHDEGDDTVIALYVEFTHSEREWACVRQSAAKAARVWAPSSCVCATKRGKSVARSLVRLTLHSPSTIHIGLTQYGYACVWLTHWSFLRNAKSATTTVSVLMCTAKGLCQPIEHLYACRIRCILCEIKIASIRAAYAIGLVWVNDSTFLVPSSLSQSAGFVLCVRISLLYCVCVFAVRLFVC